MMDPGAKLMQPVADKFARGKLKVAVQNEWALDQVLDTMSETGVTLP